MGFDSDSRVWNRANSQQWSFLGFLAVFEVGSLICGVATTSNMLIVGRAVAGLGSSGLVNGALTIIASMAPLEKRPRMWMNTHDFLIYLPLLTISVLSPTRSASGK